MIDEEPRLKPKEPIPEFASREDEAEFWDTHDLTEFEDELEVVNDVRFVVMRGEPKKPLTVGLPEDTLRTLTEQAHEQGVGASTLVRMWILEHMREQRERNPHRKTS